MLRTTLALAVLCTAAFNASHALARSQAALIGQPSMGYEGCFNRDWDGARIRNSNPNPACTSTDPNANARYAMGWIVDRPGGYWARVAASDSSVLCNSIAGTLNGDFFSSSGIKAGNETGSVTVPDWGYAYTACTVPHQRWVSKIDYWQ